jgi:hypothetical protein
MRTANGIAACYAGPSNHGELIKERSLSVFIDGKQQIYHASFLIGDEELVDIEVPVGDQKVKFSIQFVPGPMDEREAEWRKDGDVLRVVFRGWRAALGMATNTFIKFGDVDGRKLYFQMVQSLIGTNLNNAQFFVYVDRKND